MSEDVITLSVTRPLKVNVKRENGNCIDTSLLLTAANSAAREAEPIHILTPNRPSDAVTLASRYTRSRSS
jgi:Tfp pilus assembly protein PilX